MRQPELDPDVLARIGRLSIRTRIIVEAAVSGLHRASLHGSSVEFTEHKEYSPGDELRHIDWKAYAKLDRYYVKQYEQESQLTFHLVLDASASMNFAGGGQAKLEYSALCLAALGHLAIQQQDAVGLVASGDRELDAVVPPRTGTPHLHDLLKVFDLLMTRGGRGDQSPAAVLDRIAELARPPRGLASGRRRRCLIVLASDLFDPDDKTITALCALRCQGHDVLVLHVLDPHERTFPYDGLTEFNALESGAKMLVNPAAIRRDYVERMNAFCTRCRSAFAESGVDYHAATTDQPLEQTLLDVLIARSESQMRRRRTAR